MSCQDHKTCMTCEDWEKFLIEPWQGVCKSDKALSTGIDVTDACFSCRNWTKKPEDFHLADIAE